MKKSVREAYEAAAGVFEAAGYACRLRYGGAHPKCVATKPGFPTLTQWLAASPAHGTQQGATDAARNARRQLRRQEGAA